MTKVFENVPPILQDWVANMHKKEIPSHVALNYYTMLKNAQEFIAQELKKYDNAQLSKNAIKKGKR